MKKLIILAVVALAVVICEAAPRRSKMPVDENGWRCEGDCDKDTPCAFCNPPPKAKKAAKKTRKTSEPKSGARKRPRKAAQ